LKTANMLRPDRLFRISRGGARSLESVVVDGNGWSSPLEPSCEKDIDTSLPRMLRALEPARLTFPSDAPGTSADEDGPATSEPEARARPSRLLEDARAASELRDEKDGFENARDDGGFDGGVACAAGCSGVQSRVRVHKGGTRTGSSQGAMSEGSCWRPVGEWDARRSAARNSLGPAAVRSSEISVMVVLVVVVVRDIAQAPC
jgi:hypothetical protein